MKMDNICINGRKFFSPCKEKGKFSITNTVRLELTQKDFDKYSEGDWTEFFNKLYIKGHDIVCFSITDVTQLYFYLPEVIYNKLKEEYAEYVKDNDYYCTPGLLIYTGVKDQYCPALTIDIDFFKNTKVKKNE